MSESNFELTTDLRTAASTRGAGHARGPVARFIGDYRDKTRQLSRNANLYVIHVIGMDMIHGSFNVLLNLYLLAVGYDIAFIGTRLMVGFIARARSPLCPSASSPTGSAAKPRSSSATALAQ